MTSADEESAFAAEARIVRLATGLMTDIVLEYRYHYPYDPWLQLWAGLVLTGRGHPALAASEFSDPFGTAASTGACSGILRKPRARPARLRLPIKRLTWHAAAFLDQSGN